MVASGALRSSASAKVNLALAVTRVRADGYHELRSVFLRLELADTLSLTDSLAPDGPDQLDIDGDADCPVADNLVLRAIVAFRAAAGGSLVPPVAVRLRKRIPMAAGLAGGSTDAATTLCLLAARFPDAAADVDLRALAARIGSDVLFFVD
ncbi:MAG: 4-(cytidine 5'-diphospho)-2-C-methyl-D-erythritol kinase, partial [Chloroflexi bacterium]|nr:4-(cytidine 5'-diphospho)-2-C-methyl-D-erythritol kinase [Chloroflexota bacterium]